MSKDIAFFSRVLDRTSAAERYRLVTEQIAHAERFGFARAWVAQHHFTENEGGLPSPFVFLAHVAAQTSTIRLGTGVITLTLEDPVRVAEDAVVADLLTGGRIDVGLGSGSTPTSFIPFGLDVANKAEDFERKLEVFDRALAGGELGGGNTLYPSAGSLKDRIFQGTFSTFGGTRAGARGHGLMLSRTQPRTPEAPDATLWDIQEPIIDAYLDALPAGVAPRITASRTVFIADTRERARALAEEGFARNERLFARLGLTGLGLDEILRRTDSYVGSPEEVAELLAADRAAARADEVAVQVHSIDPDHEDILRSIELYGAEVAPALGWTPSPEKVTA